MSYLRTVLLAGLSGLIAGLVGGALVVYVQEHPKIRLGNVAEWVAGIGTIGALLYAGKALRVEINARREDAKRYAVAMASLVSLRLIPNAGQQLDTSVDPPRIVFDAKGNFELTNGSHGDLHDIDVRVCIGEIEVEKWTLRTVTAGKTEGRYYSKTWPQGRFPQGDHYAEVLFTDAMGWRWLRRAPDNTLIEIGRQGTRNKVS